MTATTDPYRPEYQPFLKVIHDDPDADGPRLVLADAMEEQGDSHAQLIRWQCEHARLDDADPRRFELEDLIEPLALAQRKHWCPDWFFDINPQVLSFHRGLLHYDTFRWPDEDRASTLGRLAAAGWLEKLGRLSGWEPELFEVFESRPELLRVIDVTIDAMEFSKENIRRFTTLPAFAGLRRLTFHRCFEEDDCTGAFMEALAGSEVFRGLRHLTFHESDLGEDLLSPLAMSPHFANLTNLRMIWQEITAEEVRQLADSPTFSRLTTLDLDGCDCGQDGIEYLSNSRHLRNLRHLHFSGTSCWDEGAIALARSPFLTQLETLNLRPGFGQAGLQQLVISENFRNLSRLILPGYGKVGIDCLSDEAARIFAGLTTMSRLAHLSLSNQSFTPAGIGTLARSPSASTLLELDLSQIPLGDAGALALVQDTQLKRLTRLTLSNCGIGPAGAAYLATPNALPSLRELDISQNPIGDQGVEALTRGSHAHEFLCLDLKDCGITDQGIQIFAGASSLASLRTLCLYKNQITDDGFVTLASSPHLGRLKTTALLGDNPVVHRGPGFMALTARYGNRLFG